MRVKLRMFTRDKLTYEQAMINITNTYNKIYLHSPEHKQQLAKFMKNLGTNLLRIHKR